MMTGKMFDLRVVKLNKPTHVRVQYVAPEPNMSTQNDDDQPPRVHLNATGSEWRHIEEITYKESEQFCKIFEMLGSVFKCAQDQAHL